MHVRNYVTRERRDELVLSELSLPAEESQEIQKRKLKSILETKITQEIEKVRMNKAKVEIIMREMLPSMCGKRDGISNFGKYE